MSADPARKPLFIGVTGHRILADLPRVYAGVAEALCRIRAAFPGRPLVLFSALAEGADRIVAEAILRTPRGRLIAVMPFTQDDYAEDFGPDGSPSRVHFDALLARAQRIVPLPDAPTRTAGYAQGGHYVVDHSELLLTIWDGKNAQGEGGTAEIVARARAAGKPVVIVRAGNRKPGTQEPTSLGNEQGSLLVERLPA